ncbi:hypothetical protein EJ04DRAFT_529325 [Polyplosphaeria fusca]|uniref:Uncharacterized protein n=1 Tax=Polyplosphaeria fusca TaxID=682080 RepID=A0A9P4QJE6_9PLEO|nr:hypothetical protein EJ04DRAFT_529325 [Polyplosphaeria fusca]
MALDMPWLPVDVTLPCLINPIPRVGAGSQLDFQVFNSQNSTCEATLNFNNTEFLPVSVSVSPRNCAGDQIARLKVPQNVPSGTAFVQWQCIGERATSCVAIDITDGKGNFELLKLELDDLTPEVICRSISSANSTSGRPSSTPVVVAPVTTSCSDTL